MYMYNMSHRTVLLSFNIIVKLENTVDHSVYIKILIWSIENKIIVRSISIVI